jgi:hypothetical protein
MLRICHGRTEKPGLRQRDARVMVGSRATQPEDPVWFKDILVNTRTLPEPSKTNFARILMTRCDTGDLWLTRVFCRMLEEALQG